MLALHQRASSFLEVLQLVQNSLCLPLRLRRLTTFVGSNPWAQTLSAICFKMDRQPTVDLCRFCYFLPFPKVLLLCKQDKNDNKSNFPRNKKRRIVYFCFFCGRKAFEDPRALINWGRRRQKCPGLTIKEASWIASRLWNR
jgi:hypothetical protein